MTILCLSLDQKLDFIQHDFDVIDVKVPIQYPLNRSWSSAETNSKRLLQNIDVQDIELVVAEGIDALAYVVQLRKQGLFVPTIFIPHASSPL